MILGVWMWCVIEDNIGVRCLGVVWVEFLGGEGVYKVLIVDDIRLCLVVGDGVWRRLIDNNVWLGFVGGDGLW